MTDEIKLADLHAYSIMLRAKHIAEARGEDFDVAIYSASVQEKIDEASFNPEPEIQNKAKKQTAKSIAEAPDDKTSNIDQAAARAKAAADWAKGSQA